MEYDVKSLVIGLDLGGTNSVFGIVDGDGEIIATTSIKTQTFQRVEQYVEESVKAVMQIVEQVGGMEKIRAMASVRLVVTITRGPLKMQQTWYGLRVLYRWLTCLQRNWAFRLLLPMMQMRLLWEK